MKGYYDGVALADSFAMGWSGNGNPRVGLTFEVNDKDGEVHRVTWYGNIGDKKVTSNGKSLSDITFESLINAGMTNDDLSKPEGLGSVKCSLVLDEEEVEDEEGNVKTDGDGNPIIRTIVRWVNKSAGPSFKKPMSDAEKAKFANDMKAKMVMFRRSKGGSVSGGTNGAHPNAPGSNYGPSSDDNVPY